MPFQNNPSCSCCDCLFFSDLFDRGDSTSLGGNWTEEVGDWEISGNALTVATTGAIVINYDVGGTIFDTPDANFRTVHCDVSSDANGDKLRVIVAWANSNNYHGVELEFASGVDNGKIRFFQVESGTETIYRECAVTAEKDTTYKLEARTDFISGWTQGVCILLDGVQVAQRNASNLSNSFHDAGLATGDTLAGTPTFDNFRCEYSSQASGASGNCPECRACHWPPDPKEKDIKVTISGTTNDDCTACSDFNSDFITTKDLGSCSWSIDGLGLGCDFDNILINVRARHNADTGLDDDDYDSITVLLRDSGNATLATYRVAVDLTSDPTFFCGEEITLDFVSSESSTECTWPSTITLTAV